MLARRPRSQIDAIYWDLGGVLVNVDLDLGFRAWQRATQRDPGLFVDCFLDSGLKRSFDLGDVDLLDVLSRIQRATNVALTADEFEAIWGVVVAPNHLALTLISRATHLPQHIISNTDPVHAARIRTYSGLSQIRSWTTSFEARSLKPDAGIFEFALCGQPPNKALFIDDHRENVDAARLLGFQVLLFQNTAQLARDLDALGVFEERSTS